MLCCAAQVPAWASELGQHSCFLPEGASSNRPASTWDAPPSPGAWVPDSLSLGADVEVDVDELNQEQVADLNKQATTYGMADGDFVR